MEAEKLAEEVLEYEVKVAPYANDRYGAFKVETQDKLVTALGLAIHKPPAGTLGHPWMRDLYREGRYGW